MTITKHDVTGVIHKPVEWHETRRGFIGGSDAVIIMSGDDDDVVALWKEKTGQAPHTDLSHILPVVMGAWTEPLNVLWFERQTGLTVSREGDGVVSLIQPFMRSSLDGWVESEKAVLEAKHCSGFEPWDDVVKRYYPQVQHNIFVTDANHGYLSIFMGSAKYAYEKIPRDDFYIEALIEAETKFWTSVTDGTPPRALQAELPITRSVPTRTIDMQGSNAWSVSASDWLSNKAAAKTFKDAEAALKKMVPDDAAKAHGYGVEVVRDKRGLSIKGAKK